MTATIQSALTMITSITATGMGKKKITATGMATGTKKTTSTVVMDMGTKKTTSTVVMDTDTRKSTIMAMIIKRSTITPMTTTMITNTDTHMIIITVMDMPTRNEKLKKRGIQVGSLRSVFQRKAKLS